MSLADRLAKVEAKRSNRGCVTCQWVDALSAPDRRAWDAWIAEKNSMSQLWEIATSDPVNPLSVSMTGLRHHLKHHRSADES